MVIFDFVKFKFTSKRKKSNVIKTDDCCAYSVILTFVFIHFIKKVNPIAIIRPPREREILFCANSTVPVWFFTYTHRHAHVHGLFLMHWFSVDTYALIFHSKFALELKTQFQKENTVYPNIADKHIIPQIPQNTLRHTTEWKSFL